jgi:fructokinase
MNSKVICCFGEILWDLFPEGKKLGGAPFNVASSLKDLGAEVYFISSVGKDTLGDEILSHLQLRKIPDDYIQVDSVHPTGKVMVSLDENGSAQYKIENDAAWDFIKTTNAALELIGKSDAFVFGSLIARGFSRQTLSEFLKVSKYNVFDLNLRPPFYDDKLLIDLMSKAQLLKFNDEELYLVARILNSPFNSMDQHVEFIADATGASCICITKGMFGAVLYQNGEWFYNSGYKIKVKDTVGAGDSFLATLIYGIVNNNELQTTLNRACAMGALVAASPGANPNISESELNRFMGLI